MLNKKKKSEKVKIMMYTDIIFMSFILIAAELTGLTDFHCIITKHNV